MGTPKSLTKPAQLERVADTFIRVLRAHQVDIAFGVAGGAISPIVDAISFADGIRRIDCQNESAAVFAAAAYARSAGKPAVVYVTSGPGLLNAMNGIASAHAEQAPVIVLAGEVATHRMGTLTLQDGSPEGMDLVGMCTHIAKRALLLDEANNASAALDFALHHCQVGKPGPVVLSLPIDVTTAKAPRYRPMRRRRATPPPTPPGRIEAIADALIAAHRPLLLVGSGARAASTTVRALAERYGVPVVTSPKAKGVFPDDHPLALGVFGYGGHTSAQDYVAGGVDALVVIGSRLGDPATNGGDVSPLRDAKYMAHVDIDAGVFGRVMPADDIVMGDAGSVARALVEVADAREYVPPRRAMGIVRRAPPTLEVGAISAADAIVAVQNACGNDAVYLTDVGNHALEATHHLNLTAADQFYFHTGTGSMGSGLTAAIGVALAQPRRRVVVIVGDGGFVMSAPELLTAAKYKLSLSVIVVNDGCYGMVERGHERLFGRNPGFAFDELDVAEVARGFGAQPASLADLLRNDIAGPVVVDIPVTTESPSLFRDRFQTSSSADEGGPIEGGFS